jgi:hypothetical protein
MDLEKLRKEFFVNTDLAEEDLAHLIQALRPFCAVDKSGNVKVRRADLSGRQQIKLVLAARLVAHKLNESISEEVDADDLSGSTGLPKNQAAARAKECVDEGFAERGARGSYRACAGELNGFFRELSGNVGASHVTG